MNDTGEHGESVKRHGTGLSREAHTPPYPGSFTAEDREYWEEVGRDDLDPYGYEQVFYDLVEKLLTAWREERNGD